MKRCLSCDTEFDDPGWRCPACGFEPPRRDGILLFAPDESAADDGFDRVGYAELAAREAGNFWFRARSALIEWALGRYFPHATSALEVGCGTGFVLSRLRERRPDLRLVGSELYPEGLAFARERLPDVDLYQIDARRLPFRAEFDVVGAFDVIEHVDEDVDVLRELRAATRDGVLITVPQHPRLWSAVDAAGRHRRRYTRNELVAKLRAARLEPLRVTSFVTLLLPLLAASRLRDRSATDCDPAKELRVPRTANVVLERALDVERLVIRAGLSLPAGGSLLAVARRG